MINGTTATDSKICSCGCTAPHPIATRETADGRRVLVLSDGAIIDGPSKFSPVLRGLGTPRTRSIPSTTRSPSTGSRFASTSTPPAGLTPRAST